MTTSVWCCARLQQGCQCQINVDGCRRILSSTDRRSSRKSEEASKFVTLNIKTSNRGRDHHAGSCALTERTGLGVVMIQRTLRGAKRLTGMATVPLTMVCLLLVVASFVGAEDPLGQTETKVTPIQEAPKEVVAEKETMLATDSRVAEKYSPPMEPTDSSQSKSQQQQLLTTTVISQQADTQTPIVQQQLELDGPTVSGLQEETTANGIEQQQPLIPTTTETSIVTNQPEVQQQPLTSSLDEGFTAKSFNANEVQTATNERFGLKVIELLGGGTGGANHQQDGSRASLNQSVKGGRSLKRAFSTHMGVFGRKRGQDQQPRDNTYASHVPTGEPVVMRQQHQQPHKTTTTRPQSVSSDREETKQQSKLKSGDYPDYSEILVQPDRQEQARITPQERIAAPEVATSQVEQQQELLETTTSSSLLQTTTSGAGASETATEQPQSQQQPYIRLSNIATINSTSSNSSGSNGPVKLMRIYVIDLDQKLVVGGGGGGSAVTGNGLSDQQQTLANVGGETYPRPVQYALPDTSAPLTPSSYQQEQQQVLSADQAPNQQPAVTPDGLAGVLEGVSRPQFVPEGYVLVDRDSLQANLSQMFGQMQSAAANYSHSPAYLAPPVASPSPSPPIQISAHQQQHPHQRQSQQEQQQHQAQAPANYTHQAYEKPQAPVAYPSGGRAKVQLQQQVPQYTSPQYGGEWSQQQHQLAQQSEEQVVVPAAGQPQQQGYHNYTSGQGPAQDKQQQHYNNSYNSYQVPEQQQAHNGELGAYKVTTSGDQWRPLDYSAPSNSQNHRPAHFNAGIGQQHQLGGPAISPAQPTANNKLNGYWDHDVVSLGAAQAPGKGGAEAAAAAQANYSLSAGLADVQHAPPNYQGQVYRQQPRQHRTPNSATLEASNQQPQQQVAPSHHHQSHPSSPGRAASTITEVVANGTSAVTNEQQQPLLGMLEMSHSSYGTNSLAAYPTRAAAHSSTELADEAPRIPRPQANQQQPQRYKPANSAYLAVSGPPVADGVYESETAEVSAPHQVAAAANEHPQVEEAEEQEHQVSYLHPRPRKPSGMNGKSSKARRPAKMHSKQVLYAPDGSGAVELYGPPEYSPNEAGPSPAAHTATPYGQPYGPSHHSRPMYNRPQNGGGGKSLLSWETISSVASGAARRLPSLTSILQMPFQASKGAQSALYPTANPMHQHHYQYHFQQPPQAPKSAHYSSDVSSFHRPYPLKYMNSSPSQHYSDQHQPAPYAPDLTQTEEPAEEVVADIVAATSAAKLNVANHPLSSAGNYTGPADESEVEPAKKKTPHTGGGGGATKTTKTTKTSSSKLEPAQAAVLTGIEHELARGQKRRPKSMRPRPQKLIQPQLDASLGPSEEEVPEAGLAESVAGNNEQRVVFPGPSQTPSEQHELAEHHTEGLVFAPDSQQTYHAQHHHHPRPANSVQIGQFRITPQTQFVQSIIEPSRQMLGQYFKQYVSQIQQSLG